MFCKKEKGFTLIELLAVIVILAIIALIATPIIVGVINKAKKNSFVDTAYGIVDAGELYYAKNFGNDNFDGKIFTFPSESEELKLSGEKPGGGTLEITKKGKQVLTIYDKGKNWCASKGEEDAKVTVTKYEESKCKTEEATILLPTGLTKGTPIYLNPETKSICKEANAVSTTGTKTGCMKWYVYKDNGNKTYQLILDHNTTATVPWNSGGNNTNGMKEVFTALENDTKTWKASLKARLITADEVANIAGNINFNGTTSAVDKWFYLDSNTQTQTATQQGESAYAWLFDYTDDCESSGCNIEDSSNYGYWTSTPAFNDSHYAWNMTNSGSLGNYFVDYGTDLGLRPVITA
ncbi:MAG: prepilin-type N-terminal cleavage/methylation domain-containing protein [Bacilli bacterium]|nr:prepilin-type N-terminal cleavage/methylation domain-containing protein [Bacilli bacterium]